MIKFSTVYFEMSKVTLTFDLKIRKMGEELNLDCECHAEILKVSYWKEDSEFILTLFRCSSKTFSLWSRIKFLFCGHGISNDVILSEYNASKLANFITNNIKCQ
jgi:hypothetical protein